ncbi:MAG: EF-hand domain-containing protein, partial [bacterium]|nr:EF-hand domain-containing protein [bacterium]
MSIPESDLLIYKRMLQETSETDESAASQKSVNADTYAASVSEITDENELQTIDSEAFEDENGEEAEISDTKETTETTADSAKNTEEKEESKETTDTKEADENNTSEYTLADFKKYAEDNSKIKKVLDGVDYEKVFDAIDEDGDGKLSEEELGAISKGSKELSDITAGELKKFIKNIDTDSEEDETAFENLLNKIKEALGL